MKKLSLFLFGFLATAFTAMASEITPATFTTPANTGANMTVGINASKFDQFEGGKIGAFIELDGVLTCVGSETISTGFFGLAIWGDDSSTPEADGLASGAKPTFAILHDGNVILIDEIPQFTGYVTNGNVVINDGTLTASVCVDPTACNYSPITFSVDTEIDVCEGTVGCSDPGYIEYNSAATCDTEPTSCITVIVEGCTDPSAFNFNSSANVDDGSCIAKVLGCMDDSYCNYNAAANTEDGSCSGSFGCTDSDYIEYDEFASCDTDPSSCITFIVEGCTESDAFNFNSKANVDDGSCVDVVNGCTNPSAPNYDPLANTNDGTCETADWCFTSNPAYPCHTVTSNNMSVLFPVNNAGLWNTEQSNIEEGNIIGAFYTTGTLDNDFLGYSEISSLLNAGDVIWTGDQVGLAVFGADNMINNGYDPGEELKWFVLDTTTQIVSEASVTYATPAYDGTYQEGTYVTVNSIIIGASVEEGCIDPTYMEYNPLATTDDGSCSTFISVGCNDEQYVNYAGADVDVDAIHDNAENFGDAFGQNNTIDLNTGLLSPSGVAANFHDVDVCQTQLLGCTYPYAGNYDDRATEDDGSCDWSTYALKTVDPVTGEILSVDYTFGADNDDSNNEWVESDFEYANDLYQGGAMGTGHVVTDLIAAYDTYTTQYKADSTFLADTLADVAAWFAADEAADAQELADSLTDNYRRFFVMDSTWEKTYNDTLADVAAWFAADELADSLELADTITDMQARYDVMLAHMEDSVAFTLDSAAVAFAADELADSLELADTITDMQARYDANHAAHLALEGRITDSLDHHRAPIEIDLHTGWNTIAYYLHHESPVVAQFEAQFGSEEAIQDNINIVKNNEGLFYWPDFLFDGLGMLESGQGYQVRVKDTSNGKSDFVFLHAIGEEEYRVLTPTVPAWAIEMQVENHPNDVRSLVRVVNMLGQEVNPAEQFNGEVLLYLYNDGTVEKKMTK